MYGRFLPQVTAKGEGVIIWLFTILLSTLEAWWSLVHGSIEDEPR